MNCLLRKYQDYRINNSLEEVIIGNNFAPEKNILNNNKSLNNQWIKIKALLLSLVTIGS